MGLWKWRSDRRLPVAALWVLLLCIVLVPAVTGCASRAAKGGKSVGQVVPVTIAKAALGRLNRGDILTGRVMAAEEVNLSPKIPGRVGTVPVEVGQEVKAGQVVLTLDAPELEAAVRSAEAGLRLAEAGIEQARLGVEKAKAAQEQAQENYRLSEATYQRGKLLLEQEAISQADFETRYEQPNVNAKAGLSQAETAYKQAVDDKEHLKPAQLSASQALLATAEINAANAVLKAPISGVVSARNIDPGELSSMATPALTIVNINELTLECGASEQQVNKLKAGQEVKVFVGAVRDEPFTGEISAISPAADPKTKTYMVKVKVSNPGHLLKPGMFAETDLGVSAAAVLVPRNAVVIRNNTTAVFVVRGNKAVLRRVDTGESDGRNIVVIKGLSNGEQVVILGQERLDDGTGVSVIKQD
ncbi:MAG: efflux RND transporter periplasmic adaptor subunit [Bacillota bacterium]